MPRPTAVVSSDEGEPRSSRAPRGRKSKSKQPSPEPEPADAEVDELEEEEDADGEADEAEYEVEEVISHKYGAFGKGTLGFLVKWKGFSSDENSYIKEADAGNAHELIDAYWASQEARKAEKRSRASSAASEAPKSARVRKRSSPEAEDDGDIEMVDVKSTRGGKKRRGQLQQEADERADYADMADYAKRPTWEDIVERVDTVERKAGSLTVYLVLRSSEGNKKTHASSQQCREKCPSKLFDFYEDNLKWRELGSS